MTNYLVDFFAQISPELATLLIAMLPIAELRGAIPMAVGVYHLSPLAAYFLAVIGNIIPVIFILWLIDPISGFLMKKVKLCRRFFSWLFERTRANHSHKFEKWGALALITFVAIPLPMTGGWTGALAAFVFGIPFKKALPLISLGIMIAGVIVLGMSLGIAEALTW